MIVQFRSINVLMISIDNDLKNVLEETSGDVAQVYMIFLKFCHSELRLQRLDNMIFLNSSNICYIKESGAVYLPLLWKETMWLSRTFDDFYVDVDYVGEQFVVEQIRFI